MNEIKQIHLDRQPFTISVEAHRELRAYLGAIERQVGPKGQDVLKEIELRMAELLTERGVTGDKVVLSEDVEFLKEQLGKPGDFRDDATDGAHTQEARDENGDEKGSSAHHAQREGLGMQDDSQSPKRLYRDTENAMIAGVAAGLAAYFRIDPLIVRLIFVALVLTGGAGIITYILLRILVPEAKTPSERLQMRGKAVTVDNIKRLVGRADLPAAAARVNRTSARIASTFGNVLRIAFGVIFIVLGTMQFATTMIIGSYLFIHGATVHEQVIFPVGMQEHAGVISGGIVSLLMALGFIFVGNTIIRKKRSIPGWVAALGAGILITAAAIASVIGVTVGPRVNERHDAASRNGTSEVDQADPKYLQQQLELN